MLVVLSPAHGHPWGLGRVYGHAGEEEEEGTGGRTKDMLLDILLKGW